MTIMQHEMPHQANAPMNRQSERPRFLSEADCHDVANRLARYSIGGGYTFASIVSRWTGNVRWARNQISTSGEVRDDHILVARNIDGAFNEWTEVNDSSDAALVAAVRRAERVVPQRPVLPLHDIMKYYVPEPLETPKLFFDATYQLDADRRAAAANHLVQSATDAGMLSAGYAEVSVHSQAMISSYGYARYFEYTWARYSVTVRDPKGIGSGWAGVDWSDWNRIEGEKLSRIALEKCLQSRNPVAIEPGRYTTILEPQAVSDFVGKLLTGSWWGSRPELKYGALDRPTTESFNDMPFFKSADPTYKEIGYSKIGERVIDQRISISSDPMDPDLGFPPFQAIGNTWFNRDMWSDTYHPTTWIKEGVLTNLAYDRDYAFGLRHNLGQPLEGAFRMSGGDTSVAEMIETTKRGLLVTRFSGVTELPEGGTSLLCRGYTRDGLWLIENGKISKPVKNFQFVESILTALNNVEQLGVPQRVFNPGGDDWWEMPQPVIVPPLKIRDFSFTALTTAI